MWIFFQKRYQILWFEVTCSEPLVQLCDRFIWTLKHKQSWWLIHVWILVSKVFLPIWKSDDISYWLLLTTIQVYMQNHNSVRAVISNLELLWEHTWARWFEGICKVYKPRRLLMWIKTRERNIFYFRSKSWKEQTMMAKMKEKKEQGLWHVLFVGFK